MGLHVNWSAAGCAAVLLGVLERLLGPDQTQLCLRCVCVCVCVCLCLCLFAVQGAEQASAAGPLSEVLNLSQGPKEL